MLRECCICGEEAEEKFMIKRSPSPVRPKWICWQCYQNAQKELKLYDLKAGNRVRKIEENKRRK